MNLRTDFFRRTRLVALLLSLGCCGALHAQFELKSTVGNSLWVPVTAGVSRVPVSTNGADPAVIATQPQFSGIAPTTIGSASLPAGYYILRDGTISSTNTGTPSPVIATISLTGTLLERFPSAKIQDPATGAITGGTYVLQNSRVGGVLALGVPRYFLGDEITRPTTQLDGVAGADEFYWRAQPAKPGEVFTQPTGTQDVAPVTSATVLSYYYSPHANRVFATQGGRVSVTWVTRVPVALAGDANPGLRYRYKTEDFTVSSATQKPTRTVYWTERSFSAPTISVPAGKVETINPVYSANFPATVPTEYLPVGISTANLTPELRTLWFERTAGVGTIRAYNREGRIFVEYLGALLAGTTATYEFLGADIIEVVRAATTVNVNVDLGKQITPRDSVGRLLPLDGGLEYVASPVLNTSQDAVTYYGSVSRADGRRNYFAERENEDPDRVTFYWLQQSDASIYFSGKPLINLFWPVAKNAYIQRWPSDLTSYAHNTVSATGSTNATGLQFAGSSLPQIVYQDDSAQTEATVDTNSQRLKVAFSGDGLNRSLLKFTSGNEVWYVPLYSQTENRARAVTITNAGSGYTSAPTVTFSAPATGVTAVATIANGKVTNIAITSPGANFTSAVTVTLSGGGGTGATATLADPGFQEGDSLSAIDTTAVVGQRIEAPAIGGATAANGYFTPATSYEIGGSIVSGTGYQPGAYLDPFAVGPVEAAKGAIIPVNAVPGDNQLTVWWFKKIVPISSTFSAFYVPAKIGRYTVSYPSAPDKIILASNDGSGDLSPSEIAGSLYVQNDRTKAGFNPNEEHALMIAGRAYALRDDLNNTSATPASYTSQPYVLVSYTSPVDQRPAMHAFKVEREVTGTANDLLFNYPITAGTILQGPMPLPLLPLPVDPVTGAVKNQEVPGTADTAANGTSPAYYASFTFKDRKGYDWIYRGPHANGSPTLGMQFYYTMRDGFYVPGVATQPAVGTVLPYLRPLVSGVPSGDPITGTSLTVVYRPVWPTNAPELRVGETLTLPKFGLPDVLNQSSAFVLYQQSVATDGAAKPSVSLHDPIREKIYLLGAAGGLTTLPASLSTTISNGKTYFQGVPPHLQSRFFYDPLRGTSGGLVLKGVFVDEVAGEDYVFLNVLSADDLAALIALVPASDTANVAKWTTAINSLAAALETFVEDPAKVGTFKVGSTATVTVADSIAISDSDTAVQDYALTGTGQGAGFVTLLFGNGKAFTNQGDPVAMQVIKVAPKLYTGELKVKLAGNPLDEQVTLFHSSDFAARPQDYEFEWRYAPPQDGVAPPIYTFSMTPRLGANWLPVQNPATALPSATEYAAAAAALAPAGSVQLDSLFSLQVNNAAHLGGATRPGLVVRSVGGADFSAGVPAQLIFSADLGSFTGFIVYVNGIAALAFDAPSGLPNTPASTGLLSAATNGLSKQFRIDGNYFTAGPNQIEVALYSTADLGTASAPNFRLHASVEDDRVVAGGSPWQTPNGTLQNVAIVGGSPTAPLGSPLLVMSDNYFTMRYRPKAGSNSVVPKINGTDYAFSRWMPPALVEGWIKRVLAGINPFNQRMTDLNNNAVNTDVSLLTQAGKRWEGNIAFNLEAVANAGLIEIYESVLNRGKNISIDSGYDYAPANDALLLAAGYLNDLYTVLGNEAYADAANPTISIDDAETVTEVNTSRFSFEGQVSSVLDEELALLRGRDDFLAPGVAVSPAYNRLFWNYTRGINSGEALYAVNYNIQEKAGPTADGVLDAADAQRMFPQGHGDAYGHYLTALTGYYRLLHSPKFTWTPRSEAVTVLGRAVQVDYFDERKFAAAAANVARAASQIVALTARQSFKDDPAAGWTSFRDGKLNSATNETRQWGLDEWTSRAAQGAYYHWVVGNALLPDVDNSPSHTGVQIIDRTTVAALGTLPVSLAEFQATMDSANAHLNPLGLSPGAIAFDISPAELLGGRSHYEQIYARSLQSVLNAKGAFDQAAKMTRSLRNQENSLSATNTSIVDQEAAFTNQLRELYGSPYAGDIGVGKTYATGYSDFDLYHWFVVDRPSSLVDPTAPITISVKVPVGVKEFSGFATTDVAKIASAYATETVMETRQVTLVPNQYVQFSDVYPSPSGTTGRRTVTGKLQFALLELYQAQVAFDAARAALDAKSKEFLRRNELNLEIVRVKLQEAAVTKISNEIMTVLQRTQADLNRSAAYQRVIGDSLVEFSYAAKEFLPLVAGLATDVTSAARGALVIGAMVSGQILRITSTDMSARAERLGVDVETLSRDLAYLKEQYAFTYEQAQFAYEYELLYRELVQSHFEIAQLATSYQTASANFANLLAEGDRIQADRTEFRQRAAAQIQGYRTKDLTFRTFRNEALEQYRSLYDLASRYTYLAAKSYDYETGLLGSSEGKAVIDKIVAARSLGDLTGGTPQATVSTLGDSGLAGTMARLQADWSVAKGRLGINNPDQNGTLFSLRRELFRLLDDPATTDDEAAWQQTLEHYVMSNVLSDPDVAAQCRNLKKPDGSAVPGIVISFRTTIEPGTNFFGLPLTSGDHAFSVSNTSTKIYSVGLVFRGYVGMDPYATGTPTAGPANLGGTNVLSATPYAFLIPTGTDYMLAPPLGDVAVVRGWTVKDQALPLPFNLGNTAFSSSQFYNANGTLSEQPWIVRKHQAFRPVSDGSLFYSSMPAEFTNSRLVGRSAWNSGWKIVIPANTLLANEQDGLNRFVASVKDIELFLRTYSTAGN